MDIEEKKSYPKFVGVLLALFVPGMAHFLSGKRKAGILLLVISYFIPIIGISIALIPNMMAIYIGLFIAAAVSPIFGLYIIITSWRAIKHMPSRHWVGVVASLIVLSFMKGLLNSAMPVRPHRIPTGAMQTTLMGVTTEDHEETSFFDHLLYGRYDETYTAAASGRISNATFVGKDMTFDIGGIQHSLPGYATPRDPNQTFEQGDALWSGTVIMGDHILTDRLAYTFKDPQRGDIVTFNTTDLFHAQVRPNTIYVKRIVGLPGETIHIKDGKVIVDGEPVNAPEIFQSLEYENDGDLSDETQSITLGADEYLTLGDNTQKNMSLDGRFYGPIKRDSIIAKVKTIYWPVNRIGVVE